jgi:hypothetical protein
MKARKYGFSLLAVVLLTGWLVLHVSAQEATDPGGSISASAGPRGPAQTGGGVDSLDGSFVVLDPSAGGDPAYFPGASQTFCMRAESFTPDWEYVYSLWTRFPADVTVTNAYVQGTPACDGAGTWGTFNWSFQTAPYEVRIDHPRYQSTNDHCTAYYCFDVTSGAGSGASVSWYWDGDGYGGTPHNPCSSDGYTPDGQNACDQAVYPPVSIPLAEITLSPAFQEQEDCACQWQDQTLTAYNHSGAEATFVLSYTLSGPGLIQGPPVVGPIPDGGSQDFHVQTKLDGCMLPGATITAGVHALDPATGLTASASLVRNYTGKVWNPAGWITETVTDATPTYWHACAVGTNPSASGAVGYQVSGLDVSINMLPNLQMYDPFAAAWTQLASSPHPVFGAVAGILDNRLYVAGGYDSIGFTGTTDLQVYSPASDTWNNTSYPDIPASGGRGGVSGGVGTCHTGTGSCLFTVGGSPTGLFPDLTLETWEYSPATNTWTQLDNRPPGSSTDGVIFGGGVGCDGYIFQGGDYRGYHDFYRLDATQPAGSQWQALASLPAEAGAMSPTMVCVEADHSVYLLGGDPSGNWGDYNQTVYRYDIMRDAWSGPLPQQMDTGVLGSCGLYMDDRLWTFGGTRGFGALNPPPHQSLAQVECPACTEFTAHKYAPATVDPGQLITYTIEIDTQSIQPGMIMTDPLPADVTYAGGLSATLGDAWYEGPPVNAVFWTLPYGLKMAAPHPPYPAPASQFAPEAVTEDIGCQPETEISPPASAPVEGYRPDSVLWDNGPLVTHVAGGAGGADASALQSALGMSTYGFGHQYNVGNRIADDFTITNPPGWQIDTITFFAYQTGAPTEPSSITGVYYQIWNGPPNDPGSLVVFGDLTTNRLLHTSWSNIYRVIDTNLLDTFRPIYADTASAGVVLPPGTYWIEWMTAGSDLYSGPWVPPITILGQTTTGNALQYTTAWAAVVDGGTLTPQGMPFIIQGTAIQPIQITFNATVTAPVYSGPLNQGVVSCGLTNYPISAFTRVLGAAEINGNVPLLPISVDLPMGASHTTGLSICNEGNATLAWSMGDFLVVLPLAGRPGPVFEPPAQVDLSRSIPEIQLASNSPRGAPAAPAHSDAVLWDQPTDNRNAIISQYFPDFSLGAYSADDFTITHTWAITSIYIDGDRGVLTNSVSLNWCVYPDVNNLPYGFPSMGGHIWCLTLPPSSPGLTFYDSATDVAVDLVAATGGPLYLPPGKYWLDFYPSLAFGSYGQWFWHTSATTNGQIAQVIDPLGLFGNYFRVWTPWTAIDGLAHDAAFRLEGQVLDAPWLTETPNFGTLTPGMCTDVNVTIDANGLPVDTYHAELVLVSNDPDESFFTTLVTVNVTYSKVYLPVVGRP